MTYFRHSVACESAQLMPLFRRMFSSAVSLITVSFPNAQDALFFYKNIIVSL